MVALTFGRDLALSRLSMFFRLEDSFRTAARSVPRHWVKPKLVAEITYLTWTGDGLLRQTVYVGLREDKPAEQVRREVARA
jgi:ATP-dependent DNA ligase